MMRNRSFLFSIVMTVIAFTSCDDRFLIDDIKSTPKKRTDIVLTKAQQAIVPATREFTFDLVRNVVSQDEKNVFVSPFSLQAALAMASVGATGQTQEEINAAIGLEGFQTSDVASFYKTLVPALIKVDNTVELAIANSVWASERAGIKKSYKSILEDDFHASAHPLDKDSRSAINKWVSKSTKGMIKGLDVDLSQAEILLLNAMYFNGIWSDPFEKESSRMDTFVNYDGKSTQTMFMHMSKYLRYYYGDVASAVSLPYGNGAFRMTIVIPTDEESTIDDVLDVLDEDIWAEMVNPSASGKVSLSMPRFESEYSVSMNDALKAMGIRRAFTNDAEFGEMAEEPLKISEVGQKAKIKVDEKGTEASVVTHVVMGATSAGPDRDQFVFKVDTPFFYAISEVSTGTILFAGVQKWM